MSVTLVDGFEAGIERGEGGGGLVENHVSARVFARSNPRQINQPRKTLLPSSQWRWLHPVPFPLPRDKGCASATVATCLKKKKKKIWGRGKPDCAMRFYGRTFWSFFFLSFFFFFPSLQNLDHGTIVDIIFIFSPSFIRDINEKIFFAIVITRLYIRIIKLLEFLIVFLTRCFVILSLICVSFVIIRRKERVR